MDVSYSAMSLEQYKTVLPYLFFNKKNQHVLKLRRPRSSKKFYVKSPFEDNVTILLIVFSVLFNDFLVNIYINRACFLPECLQT